MRSKLQRIAVRRNWILNYTIQKFHLFSEPDLKLSKDTLELVQEINDLRETLKSRIDRDWKNQREVLIKERERAATRQLIKLTKKQTPS